MIAEAGRTHCGIGGLDSAAAERWCQAVEVRRARRSFTGSPVSADDLAALAALAEGWRPCPDVRSVVLGEAPSSVFAGILGAYGGVSGSPSALVFIGSGHRADEAVGYTGEGLVLEATSRGYDTCWVGGLFRSGAIERMTPIRTGERIYAVSALGHARDEATVKERLLFGAGRPKARRSLDQIAPGHGAWPSWARAAAEAARIAPSAMNRQPWRFSLERDVLTLTYAGADTPRISKRLDCGIAMLHAELGALGEGVSGSWELLDGPGVARFLPRES